jgi:hypothetical protein
MLFLEKLIDKKIFIRKALLSARVSLCALRDSIVISTRILPGSVKLNGTNALNRCCGSVFDRLLNYLVVGVLYFYRLRGFISNLFYLRQLFVDEGALASDFVGLFNSRFFFNSRRLNLYSFYIAGKPIYFYFYFVQLLNFFVCYHFLLVHNVLGALRFVAWVRDSYWMWRSYSRVC